MVTTVVPEPAPPAPSRLAPLTSRLSSERLWTALLLALCGAGLSLAPVPISPLGVGTLLLLTYRVAVLQAGESVALARLRRPISTSVISTGGTSSSKGWSDPPAA